MSLWTLGAHHPRCTVPWEDCRCAALWAADARHDDLDDAYGLFWDPDYDGPVRPGSYADRRIDTRGIRR